MAPFGRCAQGVPATTLPAMRSTLASTLAAIGLLCAAAAVQASALGPAGVGNGPVGSLSWVAGHEHPSPLAHPHGRTRGWSLLADLDGIEIDPADDDRQLELPFELTVSPCLARSNGGGGRFSRGARFGSGLPDGVRLATAPARFLSAVPQGLPSPPAAALAVVALALVPGAWHRLRCTACRR